MSAQQLTLWETSPTDLENLQSELSEVRQSQDKLRKGFFKRYDMMMEEILFLKREVSQLKTASEEAVNQ